MNAIAPCHPTEADQRTARHMRMCAELADLAMQLARAAAARTLTDWANPDPPPAAPAPAPHQNPAPTRTESHPAGPATCKSIDPALLFTRLAAIVRHCITLEARLAAGAPAPQPRAAPPSPADPKPDDPRRAPACEAFDRATLNHPNRAELLHQATTRLDHQLAADPHQTLGVGNFFFDICDELGIVLDYPSLSDELMFSYVEPDLDAALTTTPEARATSPP